MFKKREGISKPSSNEIPARFVKKAGILRGISTLFALYISISLIYIS